MRFLGFLVVVAACSGRTHDAGSTPGPDRGSADVSDGDTAARPGRPLDEARLTALAAVTLAGHEVALVRRSATDLAAIVAAPDGARVTVTASACLGCAPMELAAWEARRGELAALWAPGPPGSGDALALTAPAVAGRTVIAVDAVRTLDGEIRRTFQLHWNDGATQLAVVCEASAAATVDGGAAPPASCVDLAARALAAFVAVL